VEFWLRLKDDVTLSLKKYTVDMDTVMACGKEVEVAFRQDPWF
jgi:hypothetical protein